MLVNITEVIMHEHVLIDPFTNVNQIMDVSSVGTW